ncbi:MAG: hypothetical protein U0531_20595 [Dehalococcoidia bacterium]
MAHHCRWPSGGRRARRRSSFRSPYRWGPGGRRLFDLSGGVMATVAALGLLCASPTCCAYLIAIVGPTRTLEV